LTGRGTDRRGCGIRGRQSQHNRGQRSRSPVAVGSTWRKGAVDPAPLPFTGVPGIQVTLPTPSSVLDYVKLFCLTDEDLQLVAEETNRYASQYFQSHPTDTLPPHSRLRAWTDTDAEELKLFFALFVAMGLVSKHKLANYWTTDEVSVTPFFGSVMTRNRFELILKFLHAADNSKATARGQDGYDPLYRIRVLHDRYLNRSRSVYIPKCELSLDEATMLWKGNVSYRVYNPNKPIKFGMKIYEVCEASSGYVVNWQVYTGKTDQNQEHGHSYRVVFDLLDSDVREKGYRVYMDRYYSSPKLFGDLHAQKIGATGTVMPNRKEMPKEAASLKLKRGEHIVYHRPPIQCVKWKDKRDIYMLSTVHGCTMVDSGVVDRKTGAAIQKPECILHYNKHMGGVDRNDQLSKYYSFARKVMKIWKKQFFYLLNSMVLQSFIVYLKYSLDQPKLSHYDFRLTLVRELVTSSRATDYLPRHEQRRSSSVATPPLRLIGRHFPSFIPRTASKEHPINQTQRGIHGSWVKVH